MTIWWLSYPLLGIFGGFVAGLFGLSFGVAQLLMGVGLDLWGLRRTVLTALGIAASITTLVAVLGMLDSFSAAFGRSDAEVGRTHGDRLEVSLSDYQPAGSDVVRSITSDPAVGTATPQLRIGGTLQRAAGTSLLRPSGLRFTRFGASACTRP